jgi:hypothetical protein
MSKADDIGAKGFIAIVALLAICAAIDLAWNEHVYGDWKCAFASCRKVTVEPR